MTAPARSRGLVVLAALVSLGCSSQQDVAFYPTASESAVEISKVERISTAEEEANSYWSSTYGNPRPKLTETMSLGTSDLPASAPPPPAASHSSGTALPASSNVAQANATAIVVVPGAAQWNPRYWHPTQATRHYPSRGAKQTYTGAPPKTRAPTPPADKADLPTKRTSIVGPIAPRAGSE